MDHVAIEFNGSFFIVGAICYHDSLSVGGTFAAVGCGSLYFSHSVLCLLFGPSGLDLGQTDCSIELLKYRSSLQTIHLPLDCGPFGDSTRQWWLCIAFFIQPCNVDLGISYFLDSSMIPIPDEKSLITLYLIAISYSFILPFRF